MASPQVRHAYVKVEQSAAAVVSAALEKGGVPQTPEQALMLSEQLFDVVQEMRAKQWATQAAVIRQKHPGLKLSAPREYRIEYLYKLILRSSGLASGGGARVPVALLDEATRAVEAAKIVPFMAAAEEGTLVSLTARIAAGLARHSKAAGRELVIDTAFDAGYRWARQLSGTENCAFCAMLVSRGAVYSERTAHFQAHNNCDCTAALVAPGQPQFSPQAARLNELWNRAKRHSGGATYKDTLGEFRKVLDEKPGTIRRIGRLADYEEMAA